MKNLIFVNEIREENKNEFDMNELKEIIEYLKVNNSIIHNKENGFMKRKALLVEKYNNFNEIHNNLLNLEKVTFEKIEKSILEATSQDFTNFIQDQILYILNNKKGRVLD